ncbi:hypothetical protein [Kitasatospora sp. MBT63]|uniref:hypothetical protein n=1 Tax=Kitasatospora sp. MBT63 TaxID=1444768 RepID=UPI00053A8BDC|nr:hypothetical protein [Kitasatospora sp. MBT63]
MSRGLIGTLLILTCWTGLAVWAFADVFRGALRSVRRRYRRARRLRTTRLAAARTTTKGEPR